MRLILVLILLHACTFNGSNSLSDNDGGVVVDSSVLIDAIEIDAGPMDVVGFATDHENWRVPDSLTANGLVSTEVASDITNSFWFVQDMNGDGRADLVQSMDPTTGMVWDAAGQAYWAVYFGESTGFAAMSIEWKVPSSSTANGFFARTKVDGVLGDVGTESWDLQDLDGDGCDDFVRLIDPASAAPWTDAGGDYWEVYRCLSDGFAATPVAWHVPAPIFTRTQQNIIDGCWGLIDLTGDGRSDLVHTCGNGVLAPWGFFSNSHWRLYENDSSGFSDSFSEWSVPNNESSLGFFRIDSIRGGRYWQVLDLNRDGFVELVQSAPYRTVLAPSVFSKSGSPGWKVFSSTTTGFVESVPWTVPVTDHIGGFFSVDEELTNVDGAHWFWSTLDINGDGLLDLLHTADGMAGPMGPNTWGSQASPFWKVYLGTETSFQPSYVSWMLPDSGEASGFYASKSDDWKVIDIDGDGQVELVQTKNPGTGAVWMDGMNLPYWKVFRSL